VIALAGSEKSDRFRINSIKARVRFDIRRVHSP
jgi:hypothetical protein